MHQPFGTHFLPDAQIDIVLHLSLRLALAQDLGFPAERVAPTAPATVASPNDALLPTTHGSLATLLALPPLRP